jgi:hypothetical protein
MGLSGSPAPSSEFFVGAGDPDSPMQVFALDGKSEASRVHLFDGTRSLTLPPAGTSATFLFSSHDLPGSSLRQALFGPTPSDEVTTLPNDDTIVIQKVSAERRPPSPDHPVQARIGDAIDVTGFDFPRDVQAGDVVTIRWYWRIVRPDARLLYLSNQLFDEGGQRRGLLDGRPFAPAYLPAGSTGASWFDVRVDPSTPTGPLTLALGVYDRNTLRRLPMTDSSGAATGDTISLGPIKVHGVTAPTPAIGSKKLVHFADQIDLLGYSTSPVQSSGNSPVTLTLNWGARGRPSRDYTVFVHLLGNRDEIVAQADSPFRSGRYPSSIWDAGDVIQDPHPINPPSNGSLITYRFAVGLYDAATGRRLAIVDGSGKEPGDSVVLDGAPAPQ